MSDQTQPRLFPDQYRFLKAKLAIDMLALDEEVEQIGVLVQSATECSAQANEVRDTLKDRLSEVYSVAAYNLRIAPYPTGRGGVRSEAQIESEVPLDADYKQAQADLSEARLDSALWASIADAMRTKSSALRVTADLINAGFITSDHINLSRREELRKAGPPSRLTQSAEA